MMENTAQTDRGSLAYTGSIIGCVSLQAPDSHSLGSILSFTTYKVLEQTTYLPIASFSHL